MDIFLTICVVFVFKTRGNWSYVIGGIVPTIPLHRLTVITNHVDQSLITDRIHVNIAYKR